MHAIISGRSGRALIIDADLLKSFDFADPSKIVLRKKSDLPYLFGEAIDLRILENTTIKSIQSELEGDCNFARALDLTLISLDSELPDEIRKEALEQLGELLIDSKTSMRLADVLYSEPLPEDADLKRALILCKPTKAIGARLFLLQLHSHQPSISAVKQAWQSIPIKTFGSYENREVFRHNAIRVGLFHDLVKTFENSGLELRLLEYISPRDIVQLFPNYTEILLDWVENLRGIKKLATDHLETGLTSNRKGKRVNRDRKEKRLAG